MSGGVDSSVAAFLLKEQGHQVEGLFMKNWEEDDDDAYCTAANDLADAQAVSARLQIPLHTVNFAREYWDKVFTYFLAEYRAGRTPNPDILCNKEIKFKAFLDHALALGADYIATGHYARVAQNPHGFTLLKGTDREKDQSYFLHALNQYQLAHSLFPIGEYQKTKIREIAAAQGFINHAKKDSTGICFIGERKFKTFLSEYLLAQPGNIEDTSGKILGLHDGLMHYTLGQRQGLQLGGIKDRPEAPWYVIAKDIPRNVLIVAQGNDHPMLFAQGLICEQIHWISGTSPQLPLSCNAKIRYRQADQPCMVTTSEHNHYCVMFANKQRAITPGQSIVFYQGSECLGGAVITQAIP